jgi:hypothetical protein
MTDIEYEKRKLGQMIIDWNRLMLKLPSEDSRLLNDALHHLVHADAELDNIKANRKLKVIGGGS